MAEYPLVLSARRGQQDTVEAICRQVEVAAVVTPVGAQLRGLPVPVFADWDSLQRSVKPAACCFLAPYAGLKQDLLGCLDRQVHVLLAGPVPLPDAELEQMGQRARERRVHARFGGQHCFSPRHRALSEQSRKPSFGDPVYLRQVCGGGQGLLPTWWAACDGLAQAQDLLDSGIRQLHVAACRQGRGHHITITGAFANRANLQLVVAPVHPPSDPYCMLLGSGGVLTSPGTANAALVTGRDRISLRPHPDLLPEPAWIAHFLQRLDGSEPSLPEWPALALQNAVLRAVRQALRQGRVVGVSLPH